MTIRISRFALGALLLLFAASCTTGPSKRVRPAPSPGKTTVYTASWYGPQFNGRRTASGEVYDMYGLTAAHKYLPFGTRLDVTYPKTGASARVTVNDRGPFIRGRDLDLSLGAARKIGLEADGVGRVRVRFLERDLRYVKYIEDGRIDTADATPGRWTLQFGAFREKRNADRLQKGIDLTNPGAYVARAEVGGATYFRVRLGDFKDKKAALPLALQLARDGYEVRILPR